jgi:hypothetical protein
MNLNVTITGTAAKTYTYGWERAGTGIGGMVGHYITLRRNTGDNSGQ